MQHSALRSQSLPASRRYLWLSMLCLALPWLGAACTPPGDAAPGGKRATPAATRMGASVLDLAVGDELELEPPLASAAPGRRAAVAFDGTGYFTVWVDFRTQRGILYGARVTADGTVLDPLGIPLLDDVSTSVLGRYTPAIAFDGVNFLIAVQVDDTIQGLRVSPEGTVLGPAFLISGPGVRTEAPAIAFDGTNHLVVWPHVLDGNPAGSGIYVARVSPDGTVLDPGGKRALPLSLLNTVDVSFDGENYFLAWAELAPGKPSTLMGARVTPEGEALDPNGFVIVSRPGVLLLYPALPAVSFDGTHHVVVWGEFDENTIEEVLYATRVSRGGTVVTPRRIRLALYIAEFDGFSRVDAVATTEGTVIAWSRHGSDHGRALISPVETLLLTPTGTIPAQPPGNSPGLGLAVALGSSGSGALLVWSGASQYSDALYTPMMGARLSAGGTNVEGSGFALARNASAQEVKGVASDGQNYFVVWTDSRNLENHGRSLYGVRVSADGSVLDPEALLLTDQEVDEIDVIFDGENYLVIWVRQHGNNDNQLSGTRVSPQGEVLDSQPLPLPLCSQFPTFHIPRAARGGERMLLVSNGCNLETLALGAAVFDRDGRALSTPVALVDQDNLWGAGSPAVASDGTDFLVAWHDAASRVYGQRVSASGALLGDAFVIADAGSQRALTVRFDGSRYVVIWQNTSGIYVTRVSPAGEVLDPGGVAIVEEPLIFFDGAAAFRGENLVVAYRSTTTPDDLPTMDMHGVEVGPAGEVLSRFPIATAAEQEGRVVLAANDAGQVLAAYTRFVAEAPFSARRARARLLPAAEPGPDAGPGTPDAGPGTADAGPGTADAGPGTPDAGPGTPDAGPGMPDAGPGTPDAGPGGGAPDAGPGDAGPGAPGDGDPGDGGCGCSATAAPADIAWHGLLALGLLLAMRRRRVA